jgi:uncharacterized protein YbjT (DUF2867 family)
VTAARIKFPNRQPDGLFALWCIRSIVALVTGASGFIGGRIVEMLVDNSWDTSSTKAKWTVRVFARPTSNLSHLQPLIDSKKVTVCHGSLQDEASIEKAMDGVQVVFHCAAISAFVSLINPVQSQFPVIS